MKMRNGLLFLSIFLFGGTVSSNKEQPLPETGYIKSFKDNTVKLDTVSLNQLRAEKDALLSDIQIINNHE